MKLAFVSLFVALSSVALCQVVQVPEGPSTIMVLPQLPSIVFEDSVTVFEYREQIRAEASRVLPQDDTPLDSEQERELSRTRARSLAQDLSFRQRIADYDRAIAQLRGQRGRLIREAHFPELRRVLSALKGAGIDWSSYDPITSIVFIDGSKYSIGEVRSAVPNAIVELVSGMRNFDVNANAETRAGWLNSSGIDGSGPFGADTLGLDYLVVDSGVDSTVSDVVDGHRLFGNRDTILAPPFTHNGYLAHGTATCGIVTSANTIATGSAPGIDAIFSSNNAYDGYYQGRPYPPLVEYQILGYSWGMASTDSLFGDTPEATHCAMGTTPIYPYTIENCYTGYPRALDSVIDAFDVFMGISAGNNFEYGVDDEEQVSDSGHSYNGLVCNGLNMAADSLRTNDVIGHWYSGLNGSTWVGSFGPAADGRKKPDICIPVQGMWVHRWDGTLAQVEDPSTSYAAPQASAAALLLMGCGVTNQRSIKALMLNTTFRPDSMAVNVWTQGYGWGMLDVDHAMYHVTHGEEPDYFESTVRASGLGGDKIYFRGTFHPYDSSTRAYDRATVVWEKHVEWAYGDTAVTGMPLTNIDLFLFDGNTGELVSESISTIDNAEQVLWESETETLSNGIIVVDCESALPMGYTYEPVSLATEEGFEQCALPRTLIGLNAENESMELPVANTNYEVSFRVFLSGTAKCDTIWPSLSGLDGNTVVVTGPTPACMDLAQGDTVVFRYTLNSSTGGRRTIQFDASSDCYRTHWSDGADRTYTVFDEDPNKARGGESDVAQYEFEIAGITRTSSGVFVAYRVPRPMAVQLEVFDVRGRRIYDGPATYSSGVAGSLRWDLSDSSGRRSASGVYFLRVSGGGYSVSRKFVVVR